MIKLTIRQKEAVAALLTELFNAENIVEIQKIRLLNQKLQEYGISSHEITDAKCMTLESAVFNICSIQDIETKRGIIRDLESIARRDGYCSPEEAILIQALKMAIIPPEGKNSVDALVFSMRSNALNFDGRKATYIHPDKNLLPETQQKQIDNYADKIMRHLDELVLLFYCFGYDFVYIPKLREDYGKNAELQEELKNFSFFFSNLPKESIESAIAAFGVVDDSRRFTTAKFSQLLFSGRDNDIPSDHDSPAFLIKICDSYIIDKKENKRKKIYSFLYLPIFAKGISGIIDTAKDFFQQYIDMVDQSAYIVCPESSKRLRHFDLYQSLISRIATDGLVKSSPHLILDLTHKTNECLILEKAINGKSVSITLKTYITEFIFALWCTANAAELEKMHPIELRIASKDVWEFINSLYPDLKKTPPTYDDFVANFSHFCYNLGQSYERKKLDKYVSNINDYKPLKPSNKEDGPIYYRIAARDIDVIEGIGGRPVSFEESELFKSINSFFYDSSEGA